MRNYVDSCHKESERCPAYPEQITAYFEKVANITVDGASAIPQEEKMGLRNIVRSILMMKMKQIIVLNET